MRASSIGSNSAGEASKAMTASRRTSVAALSDREATWSMNDAIT